MTSTSAKSRCDAVTPDISVEQLDAELEQEPSLSEDERSAIWLYAWCSRSTAMRVAGLAA